MRSSNYGIFLPAVSAVGLATLLFQSVFLTGLIDAKPTPVPQLGAVQQGAFESGCNTCWNRARNAPFSNEIIAKSVGSADHPGIVEYVLVGLNNIVAADGPIEKKNREGPCNFVVAEYFNIVGGTPSQTCEEYQDQIFQEYLDSTG